MVRAGLCLYAQLALLRNTHSHRMLSAEEGLAAEPVLREVGRKQAWIDDYRRKFANC